MKCYRVLIITNDLYPDTNANSEIAYRIAHVLYNRYGCEISMLGYSRFPDYEPPKPKAGFITLPIPSITNLHRIEKQNPQRIKRLATILFHPECYRLYINAKRNIADRFSVEYRAAIARAINDRKYDCVIGFSNPRTIPEALSNLSSKLPPFIVYKLDPWSTSFIFKDNLLEQMKEKKADSYAAAIITTDLINRDYPDDTESYILDKICVLKFPNIQKYPSQDLNVHKTASYSVNCVFAGALYQDIRSPQYTLKLFAFLKPYGIGLDVFGFSYSNEDLLKAAPENVTYRGKVSSDEALANMQSADILVNIGNTVLNQMPSKILTYISLGKPILNIIKDPNCPTLPYMEKYPLALNILETPEPTPEDIACVRDFILTNKGKQIPFETIKELYYDCTPEYVGGKVYEIIQKVVEENRSSTKDNGNNRKGFFKNCFTKKSKEKE